jgi:hypothetical protein
MFLAPVIVAQGVKTVKVGRDRAAADQGFGAVLSSFF